MGAGGGMGGGSRNPFIGLNARLTYFEIVKVSAGSIEIMHEIPLNDPRY